MGNLSFERKEGVEAMLEHDPEKWKPVFRTDHAQTKRWDHDAIPLYRIMILIGWLSLSTEPFKPGRAQLSCGSPGLGNDRRRENLVSRAKTSGFRLRAHARSGMTGITSPPNRC
jgi:hypothetical protein